MKARLLLLKLERETDIVLARKRTRRLCELVGFDAQDQTRITTALSEIARNAFEYAGGGKVEFRLSGDDAPQLFEIVVSDRGPGIAEPGRILDGLHRSTTGMGVGITGARRLMDRFDLQSEPGEGTVVRLGKFLPPRAPLVAAPGLRRIGEALAGDGPADPMEEIRSQNQLIMSQFEELKDKSENLQRLNQELQETNRGVVALYAELEERADHLRRADEVKSKFLSHMSHEFRTPLNSILALSRLLLSRSDGPLTAEQETQVEFVRKSATDLTDLVNDLLDLAKVAAGKITIVPTEFLAEDMFGALRGMLRPLLVGDAISLVFDDASSVPQLCTDEGKVSQILRNFISNALKFTERGEIRVGARHDAARDHVVFSVADTGIGIAEPDIDLIFQEFGQVAHPLQSRVKGTGLGLPLSRRLAELLGGEIGVSSAVGRGSVFSVSVPRRYLGQDMPAEAAEDWHPEEGRVPLLVVEDNPADAFTFQRVFANSMYQPRMVRSVAQAERALKDFKPAAILTDIMLCGDESWRFLLGVRAGSADPSVPIVVVSSTGDEQKALHLGADDYIRKPIERERILAVLGRLTGAQGTTRLLIVDDEIISRYLLRQLLPRGSFNISEAQSGAEALAMLADGGAVDAILLDLNMPQLSGFDLLGRLAKTPALAAIPVIVVTSQALTAAERARLARAALILSKSELSAVSLGAAIEGVLGARQTGGVP